jgi:hypothetical protein
MKLALLLALALLLSSCGHPETKAAKRTDCNHYRVVQLTNGTTTIQTLYDDGWKSDWDHQGYDTLDEQLAFVKKYSCEYESVARVIAP